MEEKGAVGYQVVPSQHKSHGMHTQAPGAYTHARENPSKDKCTRKERPQTDLHPINRLGERARHRRAVMRGKQQMMEWGEKIKAGKRGVGGWGGGEKVADK